MSNHRSSAVYTCQKCGKEYHPWKDDGKSKFCSRACAPQGRKPTIEDIPCKTCGVIFRPVASKRVFCSRECYKRDPNTKKEIGNYLGLYRPEAPGAYPSGQILEHRFVMQEAIGRPLERYETVHHINGDTHDNRLENLQLRTGRHGKGVVHQCNTCGSQDISAVRIAD